MSRWDEKDLLIGIWLDPEQLPYMGKRESLGFLHRMLQKHDNCQNDSCDGLTCEFAECPDFGDKKADLGICFWPTFACLCPRLDKLSCLASSFLTLWDIEH